MHEGEDRQPVVNPAHDRVVELGGHGASPSLSRFGRRCRKHPRRSALPGSAVQGPGGSSEEHTSELQSLMRISYAVFCLKKKIKHQHAATHIIKANNSTP